MKKDIISKHIFKPLVQDLAVYLFHLPVTSVELLETQTQRIEDRRADLVAKVSDGEQPPFILHIEIQNDNQQEMPVRMLRYLTDILFMRSDLPVRQYVIYIGKAPLKTAASLVMQRFTYVYDIIDMHQIDCQGLLQQDTPDAWVLAVLCHFQGCDPREMVHTILGKLVERLHRDPPRLREYISMLEVLADNRDLGVDIKAELKMLTIEIEKLPSYQIGLEKGIEQGLERGMEQGLERGIEQGLEQGREEGIERGLEQGAQARAVVIARNLLAIHLAVEQVATVTGLSVAEVEGLRQNLAEEG